MQDVALARPVQVLLPGVDVAVYPVIGDPPLAGTDHATVAVPLPALAVATGADGLVAGTRSVACAPGPGVSLALDAVTVTV